MKKILAPVILLLVAAISLSACGGGEVTATAAAPQPPEPSRTPDPCAPENIPLEAAGINALMREFDDAAQLASLTPRDQMVEVIPSLQDIRRRAEDLDVPPCLATLKALQITHMNTVINTLLAFLGGAESDVLVQGIAQARLQHEDYNREMARLIGATYAPVGDVPPAAPPAADTTPAGTPGTASATVTNNGTTPVNLRAAPDVNALSPGLLEVNASAVALGKTADGQWIQIVSPLDSTQLVWIFAQLVTVTGGETLPVVTPTP